MPLFAIMLDLSLGANATFFEPVRTDIKNPKKKSNLISNHFSLFFCCELTFLSFFVSFRFDLAPMPLFANFEIKSLGANATFCEPPEMKTEKSRIDFLSIGFL
jgi:hypothetical protein